MGSEESPPPDFLIRVTARGRKLSPRERPRAGLTVIPRAPIYGARGDNLSVGGLAAGEGDRNMSHRRIGLGAMPMAFTGLYMHDVAYVDLALLALIRDHTGAGGYDQHLVAVMCMPAGRAPLAEIDNAAVVVGGLSGLNDRLA